MSIEKEIQDYYISMLQKYSIDFLRLKNNGQKGKSKGAYSYGAFREGHDNNKYFPDVIFCFNGKVYLREFGERGKNSDRKQKQEIRMFVWRDNGNCDILTVYDMDTACKDWIKILDKKYLEII